MTEALIQALQVEIGAIKTAVEKLTHEKDELAQKITDAQTHGNDERVAQLQDKLDAMDAELGELKTQLAQKTDALPGGPHGRPAATDPSHPTPDDGPGFGFWP